MTTSYNSQSLLIYYILLSFLPCITPATSIGNPDLERYFRTSNTTQTFASEERITMDVYTYAFLNYSFMDNHEMHFINYPEEKARYGEGKILSVHGQLVHISDVNDPRNDTACSGNILGTKGRPIPQQGITWIALVRRGHCTFEEKVRNVHLKGAAGVIIYNDKPVINLEKMQIKGKTRNITAVITYQDIGLEMAMRLDDDVELMAHIIEGRSGMRPISTFNRTSVLFVAISFIILMLISLIWLIVYYIQRFRNLHTKDQQSRHLCSVTQKAIMKIPTKTGKTSDEKDADSDCCAICIEAYKISDLIRVLPCKHEFHKNCIDPWLIEHRTCPMCKLDVLKFYGYVVGDELQTIPTATAPLPTIAIDEPDVPVVVVGVLPTQTTVSSLNQYHQYSHHRNPHPSNAQQQPQQQQQQLQMNGNECGSISSSSNSYDSSTTTNPPPQCTLVTQQCCNNVEGRAQPIELAANNSSCSGVSGSSSTNNGHQSCASISNNSCPIHTVAHMPPAQCNRSNLLNGHHQKNDLCSWHISVPGLNLTINSNQPFVVESPANDNALNDARSSQFCTSSRQVTDV